MKKSIRRQSPAMVVSIVALIVALTGTAVGAAFITKKQAKNIARTQAGNEIAKQAPGLAVASANTANSANHADSANSANTAATASSANVVGGMRLAKFEYRGDSTTGSQTILNDFGGLTLMGGCGGNDIDFNARNDSGEPAELVWNKVANGLAVDGGTLSPFGTGIVAVPGVGIDDGVTGQMTFKTTSAKIVTVDFSLDENVAAPRCSITGTAIAG
jgi:hypothetical protein